MPMLPRFSFRGTSQAVKADPIKGEEREEAYLFRRLSQ
jgi:hypothetical protein